VIEFLGRQAAHVGGKVRLGACQATELYKFVGAELIQIHSSPEVCTPQALLPRPYPPI